MIKLFCIEIEVGLARPLSFSSFDSLPFFGLFPAFLALAVKFNFPPVLDGEPNLFVLVGDPLAFKVFYFSILIVFLFAPGDSSVAPKPELSPAPASYFDEQSKLFVSKL